jgi:hypothetical protein
VRTKERRIRQRELREQESEEYRLREQQGLSPSATPENSLLSEEEEEESDRAAPPKGWNPSPPSPRAAEAAVTQVPVADVEARATGPSLEEPASAVGAPASAARAPASATVMPTGATAAPPKPSRKRKWDFSNLR